MGEIHGLNAAFSWSVSKLAECFGLHRTTLTKKIREAGLEPTGDHRGSPTYSIRDVARLLHGPSPAASGPTNLDEYPEARKAWYQSENERLKFEKEVGQLIPESEHSRCVAAVLKSVSSGLESLPDILERDAGLDPDQVSQVIDLVDGLRSSMAERARQAVKA